MYAVTSTALVRRTRATLRSAEFGFFGVVVYTRVHTPRRCGLPLRAAVLVLETLSPRPLRTSWLMVGIDRLSLFCMRCRDDVSRTAWLVLELFSHVQPRFSRPEVGRVARGMKPGIRARRRGQPLSLAYFYARTCPHAVGHSGLRYSRPAPTVKAGPATARAPPPPTGPAR